MFSKNIKTIIIVDGMSCNHCANHLKEALEQVNNIKKVKIDLESKQVIISSKDSLDINNIKEIIDNLGYKYIEVKDGKI